MAKAHRPRGTVQGLGLAIICCLLLGSPVRGADDFMARLLAAARSLDEPALKALAEERSWDPWLVVDFLAGKSLAPAGVVFARHVASADHEALLNYARAVPEDPPGTRKGVHLAMQALAAEDAAGALALVRDLVVPPVSVLAFDRLRALGDALDASGRTAEASRTYASGAKLAAALGWIAGEDIALDWLFWCLIEESEYGKSLAVLDRRRALNRRLENKLELAFIDRWEGTALLSLGTPAPALAALERALGVFERAKRMDHVAHVRTQMALAHAMRGAYARALSIAERSERESRDREHGEGVLYAQQTRVSVLLDMGKHDLAVQLSERILASKLTRAVPRAHASALTNMAMGLARLGRRPEAARRLTEAVALCRKHELDDQRGSTLLLRGLELHVAGGDFAAALADFQASQALAPAGSVRAAYAEFGLGAARVGSRAYAQARTHLQAALTRALDLEIVDLQALVHERLLAIAVAEGDGEAGLAHARSAADAIDLAAHGLADEEAVEVRTQADRARVFRNWVRAALLGEGRVPALYEAIESGRARLLLAALGGAASVRGLDLPPAMAAEERRAQAALLAARERYATLRKNDAGRPERQKAHKAFLRARTGFREVASRVQRERGSRGALAYPQPVALPRLRATLPPDVALVLFATREDGATAVIVTAAGARRVDIRAWDAVRAACAVVGDRDAEAAAFRVSLGVVAGALLDELKLPASIRRIFLSPDGPLAAVPWPAIEVDRERPRLLAMIPSATTFHALDGSPVPGQGVLAFGDPLYEKDVGGRPLPWLVGTKYLGRLEHSAGEVEAVAVKPFLRGAATETRFKQEVAKQGDWDLVHLACHGVMDRETPSLSSLALSPSAQDDGFLTALEVFGMRLRARLVVLSACDVGRGQQAAGEGVLGLVRAFMAAGSPRLLVSLWAADDKATAALMKRFHQARGSGLRPHEALRLAQRHVRDFRNEHGRRPWTEPYYWAGWVLWGAFE